MQIQNSIVILFISLNIVFALLGYLIGRLTYSSSTTGFSLTNKTKEIKTKEKIEINDTKVVTAIKTDNLEKKFETLGDKKQSQENISSAIDKLKSIRG